MKKNILFIFETVYRLSINRSFKLALDNINMKVIISCLNTGNYFHSLISVRIFFKNTHMFSTTFWNRNFLPDR